MRVAVKYRSASKDTYNRFCSAHPNIKLSYKEWCRIIYTFMEEFVNYILDTGEGARLPHGLGVFSIQKKKIRRYIEHNGKVFVNAPIDWKRTKEVGKRVYMSNPHTDGNRYSWIWLKKHAKFEMASVWYFKASRVNSRKLKDYLKKPDSIYHQLYRCWVIPHYNSNPSPKKIKERIDALKIL